MYQLLIKTDKDFPTKNDIISLVENVRIRYENGETDTAVADFVALKQIEFYVKEAMKIVSPYATAAVAGMSAEQRKNTCNAKLTFEQSPMNYDFSGNAEWDELTVEIAGYEQQAAIATNKRKAVEENLILTGAAKAVEEHKMTLSVTLL